jgi:hypothetical protein
MNAKKQILWIFLIVSMFLTVFTADKSAIKSVSTKHSTKSEFRQGSKDDMYLITTLQTCAPEISLNAKLPRFQKHKKKVFNHWLAGISEENLIKSYDQKLWLKLLRAGCY